MASSLEVMRQRILPQGITQPGHYPIPPSVNRRFPGTNENSNRLFPVGYVGRHSWNSVSAQANSLLAQRVQRLNLRLTAPTPGEEELCRHWMENSARYSKMSKVDKKEVTQQSKIRGNDGQLERPRTAQTPRRHQRRDATGRQLIRSQRFQAGNREHMMSSDSERVASPNTSQRSSPAVENRRANAMTATRNAPGSNFCRIETPRNSPTNFDSHSPPRPTSARPRSRARNLNTPPTTRNNSATASQRKNDIRRWSLCENVGQNHEIKDDDSAYSSSREVILHSERMSHNSPGIPRSPPNQLPKDVSSQVRKNTSKSRFQSPRVMVSGQDGRPVFYYHDNKKSTDDGRLSHHYGRESFLPLRQATRTLQRPVTQPAMGTQHSRQAYRRRGRPGNLQEEMEEKLTYSSKAVRSSLLSTPEGRRSYVTSVRTERTSRPVTAPASDAVDRQLPSIVIEQKDIKSISEFIEPEMCLRIVKWLSNIEPNPDLYYGFETDLFGDSMRTPETVQLT